MSQAILFLDREWCDDRLKAVFFIVLANGFPLTCAMHGEAVLRRFNVVQDALECFLAER